MRTSVCILMRRRSISTRIHRLNLVFLKSIFLYIIIIKSNLFHSSVVVVIFFTNNIIDCTILIKLIITFEIIINFFYGVLSIRCCNPCGNCATLQKTIIYLNVTYYFCHTIVCDWLCLHHCLLLLVCQI